MEWRSWVRDRLLGHAPFVALVPAESVHGAGSLNGRPDNIPFVVLRLGPLTREPGGFAQWRELTVWAHDEPGGYLRIDEVLAEARVALETPVNEPGAVLVEWQGGSPDLADDGYNTITKNDSYRLVEGAPA